MPTAIAVSPHLDDAAFSCGGTLARLAEVGWDVTICTAFTLSVPEPTGFALECQLDKGLPPDADYMALRRAEDAEACRRLGARPLWLPFAEAPHRGYANARALFGPLEAEDDVGARLIHALRCVLASRPDLILGPQAVGGHVDHVQVVHALHAVINDDAPVLWWTDFPYVSRLHTHPRRPFEAVMDAYPQYRIDGHAAARLAACSAYETQIGFQFGGVDGLADALAKEGAAEPVRLSGLMPHNVLTAIL